MRCSVVLLHCKTGSVFCLHSVWRWIATSFFFQTGYLFELKRKWILTGIVYRLLRLQFNVPTVCLCRDIWMKCTHMRSCFAHPTDPRRDTCTHFRWKMKRSFLRKKAPAKRRTHSNSKREKKTMKEENVWIVNAMPKGVMCCVFVCACHIQTVVSFRQVLYTIALRCAIVMLRFVPLRIFLRMC